MKLWIKESRSRWSEHHGPLKTIAARFVPAVYAGPFAPAAELFSERFDPTRAGSLGGSSVDGGLPFADPLLVVRLEGTPTKEQPVKGWVRVEQVGIQDGLAKILLPQFAQPVGTYLYINKDLVEESALDQVCSRHRSGP